MLLKNNVACALTWLGPGGSTVAPSADPFQRLLKWNWHSGDPAAAPLKSGHGERENGGDWRRRFHVAAHLSNHGYHNFAGREPRRSRGASLLAVQWHDFLWETTRFQIQVQGALSTEFTVTIEELGITSRTNCSHCLGKLLLSCPRPIILVSQCL